MSRRKGERPIARPLDSFSHDHPVARCIREGDPWFYAWQRQRATPFERLARQTGIAAARLMTISRGDRVSRAEVDALARAWEISTGDLIASMPSPDLVQE